MKMLVDVRQRVYVESALDGGEYSCEFGQSTFENITELMGVIPDDATRVFILTPDEGTIQDITEGVAEEWVRVRHDLEPFDFATAKPEYVKNSIALYEYAHENREDY